jgi:predicted SprT family Zn-dependent metalloprotease
MVRTIKSTMLRARYLANQQGLYIWKIQLENRATRAGACFFEPKIIKLSKKFITSPTVTDAQVDDVILHEIAHALAGPNVPHHGKEWKKIARSIGCSATRCVAPFVPPKWRVVCACGMVNQPRYKANRKWAATKMCGMCNEVLKVVPAASAYRSMQQPQRDVIDLTGDE